MRIAEIIEKTEVEGPGIRSALWLQGCTINCLDCCNQSFLPKTGGSEFSPVELAKKMSSLNVEGITILGGEPLQQPDNLKEFLLNFKRLCNQGIMLFTGYSWQTIESFVKMSEIIKLCDLVIAGPFIKALSPDNRRWIGSSNQTIHFITDKYLYLENNWEVYKKEMEIHIKDGEIIINGMPFESGIF